ncbi:MAG: hypothetical protein RJA36_3366 [Pseudomonadota bacterium]|jgi:cobalt-zinc-cadmium efflux system outer membrane protein
MSTAFPPGHARHWLAAACLAGLCTLSHSTENAPLQAAADTAASPATYNPSETVVLTLGELTEAVLASNVEVQAAELSRAVASAGVITAGALPNPRLEWTGGQQTARLPGGINGNQQGLAISQLIERPSLRQARTDAAVANERGSEHLLSSTRNELKARTQRLAYEWLWRQAEAAAAIEALNLLEQVRERVRLRVASGEAARYELIKADVEVINARQRQQNASLQAEQVRVGLNRLAGGRLPAQWVLNAQLKDDRQLPELEELQALLLQHNPELKALQSEVERTQARLQLAQAGRWPGVELRLGQSRDPEQRLQQLGVSLQIPLLDQQRGPLAEAAAEIERARARLDGRQAELRQQLLQAWKALEMAKLRVRSLSEGSAREAESALKVAQAAYRFGERGILDVLDAERVLRNVRTELLEARYQVQAAHSDIDLLVGRQAGQLNP